MSQGQEGGLAPALAFHFSLFSFPASTLAVGLSGSAAFRAEKLFNAAPLHDLIFTVHHSLICSALLFHHSSTSYALLITHYSLLIFTSLSLELTADYAFL